MRLAIVAAVVVLLAASARAQSFEQAVPHGKSPIDPESFTFTDGARTCRVTAAGAAVCRRDGGRDWPFRLPTGGGRIDELYFRRHGEDLLIAYGLNDGEGAWGQIVRIARGAVRPAWRFHVPGLNMAAPVLDGDNIYVAALAFVARVDAGSGWPEWQLDRAYAGGGYEIPELSLSGSRVVVQSRDGSSGKIRSECFDVETGDCTPCGP